MPLKLNWRKKENQNQETSDLYQRLKKEIQEVRKPGQPPLKDPQTFSRYVCDLCSTSLPLRELKQCSICGRWACGDCWTPEYYVCNSCGGIIKIHTLQCGTVAEETETGQ